MTNQSRLIVMTVLVCLTIQQSAWAQGPRKVAQAPTASDGTTAAAPVKPKPVKKDVSQSVLFATPDDGQILLEMDLMGQNQQIKMSGLQDNMALPNNANINGTNTLLSTRGTYGFSKHFYMGASFSYVDGSQETSYSSPPSSYGSYSINSYLPTKDQATTQGFSEPSLIAGLQTTTTNTRLIGELEGKIPMGDSQETRKIGQSTYDNKDGGMSFVPRFVTVTDLHRFRILTETSYKLRMDRTIHRDDQIQGFNSTVTKKGGNVLTLGGSLELPQTMNLGFGLAYSKTDDSTASYNNSSLSSTSHGLSLIALSSYMGFYATDNVLLTPRVIYLTTLDKSSGSSTIDQLNSWVFDVGTKFRF